MRYFSPDFKWKGCIRMRVNSTFRYKRPKRAVRALRVWQCSTNPRPRLRVSAAFVHDQWANQPCGFRYFSLQVHAKLELAYRLQTSKMRRNSTSLNTCQHDVNIVIVCVAKQRCTASFKTRKPCLEHFAL